MKLGPYEVVKPLGRGGMGAVYRARSPQGRDVAVKVLLELAPSKRARFDRERRLLETLGEAEGFVPLLDAGDAPTGPFLVMPFVGGGTLRDRLDRGPFGIEETIRLGRELARALSKAHEMGIVHRDLKPENILYTESGRALIADLGLGKHFDESDGVKSISLSATGTWRGTPGYMAPEQMRDAKSSGPAADVFALGAILYECLAGDPPYKAESLVGVLDMAENAQRAPLAKKRPGLPAALLQTIDRALDPRPTKRFPDAGALLHALEGEPAKAAGPDRRSALPLVLAASVLFALVFLGGAVILRGHRARLAAEPPRVATAAPGAPAPRPTAPAAADPHATAKFLYDLALVQEETGPWEQAYLHVVQSLELEPASSQAWHLRGILEGERGRHEKAIESYTRAIETGRSPTTFWARAYAYDKIGARDAAIGDYGRAIELDPKDKVLWRNRGALYYDAERFPEAFEDLDMAIKLDPRYADAWSTRALVNQRLGLTEDAIADNERAVALGAANAASIERTLDALRKARGLRLVIDANTAKAAGQLDLAMGLYTRALVRDPLCVDAWINRGLLRSDRGDQQGAFDDYTKALEADPKRALAYNNRGVVRTKQGDDEGARADYTKAVEADPGFALAWKNRALLRERRGDTAGALEDLAKFLDAAPADRHLDVRHIPEARDKIAEIHSRVAAHR